jgi:hypothetical protein
MINTVGFTMQPRNGNDDGAELRDLLREYKVTHRAIGVRLGISRCAVTSKIAEQRAWANDEVKTLLVFLQRELPSDAWRRVVAYFRARRRCKRYLTYYTKASAKDRATA